MPIPYLQNHSWNDLTREERFYCYVLYSYAAQSPNGFARWVSKTARLDLDLRGDWEVGVEVCLYRDFLWQQGDSARKRNFPSKRTFDLCLFGPKELVVIEAKVHEPFLARQTEEFSRDANRIKDLFELESLRVLLVSLASSKYYENVGPSRSGEILRPFKGRLSWADAHKKYRDPLLKQADKLYQSRVRKLTQNASRSHIVR